MFWWIAALVVALVLLVWWALHKHHSDEQIAALEEVQQAALKRKGKFGFWLILFLIVKVAISTFVWGYWWGSSGTSVSDGEMITIVAQELVQPNVRVFWYRTEAGKNGFLGSKEIEPGVVNTLEKGSHLVKLADKDLFTTVQIGPPPPQPVLAKIRFVETPVTTGSTLSKR
ncbi:MAG: hypothetical protein WCO03_00400 [bacterium]